MHSSKTDVDGVLSGSLGVPGELQGDAWDAIQHALQNDFAGYRTWPAPIMQDGGNNRGGSGWGGNVG